MTTARQAAALFTAAFNVTFLDDDWLTIGVHSGTGAEVHVTGQLDDGQIQFDPADVEMLLNFLARILANDSGQHAPYGVVSVKTPFGNGDPDTWAWHLKDMTPLTDDQALSWLGDEVCYRNDGISLHPPRILNWSDVSITDDVKKLLADRFTDDGQHGTPGHNAGRCGQCRRPVIWDRTGRRVHDEQGEYLCHAVRSTGDRKATHVLVQD